MVMLSISTCVDTMFSDILPRQALEACIVHLDVTSIDIHQTMTLCWQHNLYDAILYIYNRGMQDYITPFEELITVLQNALATGMFS
jgi:hypothetical protein